MGEGMSRRDFLRGARDLVGLAALGFAANKIVGLNESVSQENKEHMKIGEAVIVKKVSLEGETGVDYRPVSVSPDLGGGFRSSTEPDEYKIVISFNGKEIEKEISSKREFDEYTEGEKIPVVYDDRTMEITSIEKVVIEHYRQNSQ